MSEPLPRDFHALWLGQSISFVGSAITRVALPLSAVLVLGADASQMGWLTAMQNLPMAIFGLIAGVWVDRMRRRPMLVASDVLRGLLLASIPVAHGLGVLSLWQLYAVTFGTGAIYVVSAVADRAYLPTLLDKAQLVRGNSRIWFSMSAAQTAGPGLAGLLVAWLTAPMAIALDAASFGVGALLLLSIRHREERPAPRESRAMADIVDGLRYVARHPLLRPLVLCGAMHNICSTMIMAIYFVYLPRELQLGPETIGLVLLTSGLGALAGSALAPRVTHGIGVGPTLIGAQVLTGVARLCIPLAAGPTWAVVGTLVVSEVLLGAARPIFNIAQISLRQSIIPAEAMGRVNATIGFVLWSLTPLGALAGGYLGEAVGLRPTLAVAATGVLLATGWALFSQLRIQRTLESPS